MSSIRSDGASGAAGDLCILLFNNYDIHFAKATRRTEKPWEQVRVPQEWVRVRQAEAL